MSGLAFACLLQATRSSYPPLWNGSGAVLVSAVLAVLVPAGPQGIRGIRGPKN